ncbi:sushi, von Willebrand factor type A, EGF and pentraxin domain-containing protein 1-like isoform X2 [Pogoniulus pusillus]|uniref:sushi, von Willebrand factor type A, EGF and pentraxin domain-containing protein 1-like isoform X2 n=1 Tax=Pogoniulus pusillus TaxID=488313 RepID=UPI0030B97DD0
MVCALGLGLLFLAVLVSSEDPEGNRVFGGRGAYRVPHREQGARPLCHSLAGIEEAEAGLQHCWGLLVEQHSRDEGWAEVSLCWAITTLLGVSEGWGAGRRGSPWPLSPVQSCSALLPAAPGDLDTYWSGTAPICLGGCKGKHKELKRSQCGNGSCCWLGYKSFCRVNCGRPEADFSSVVYGNDWWVGSVVRYRCRPGFLLRGDPASACQSSGRWTPKPTCLRICLQGRIEISEWDIAGSCSSSCSTQTYTGGVLKRGCIQISACVAKQPGWPRWLLRCAVCECDCHVPCASPV